MRKIDFLPRMDSAGITDNAPIPAKKALPGWFKSFNRFLNNEKKMTIFPSRHSNATVKMCPPFLDAMMTGYTICLETDLAISPEGDDYNFIWGYSAVNLIDEHLPDQVPKEMIPDNFHSRPYKFMSLWGIKLPKGYSAFITHPVNRPDLPFLTMSGLVDVDSYNVAINFPFLLKKNFSGIIPAGTPIAQVIPVKREQWRHEIRPYSYQETSAIEAKFLKTLYRSYKKQFWHPKQYD